MLTAVKCSVHTMSFLNNELLNEVTMNTLKGTSKGSEIDYYLPAVIASVVIVIIVVVYQSGLIVLFIIGCNYHVIIVECTERCSR